MIFKGKQMNLFDVPQGYCLVHCISADFALGAGIALGFNKVFDMKRKLNLYGRENWDEEIGRAIQIENVFNLVTKARGYDRPRLEALQDALVDLKNKCVDQGITKLAMPKIGCGLDRLNWDDVRESIEDIFGPTDIEILVCVLDDGDEEV